MFLFSISFYLHVFHSCLESFLQTFSHGNAFTHCSQFFVNIIMHFSQLIITPTTHRTTFRKSAGCLAFISLQKILCNYQEHFLINITYVNIPVWVVNITDAVIISTKNTTVLGVDYFQACSPFTTHSAEKALFLQIIDFSKQTLPPFKYGKNSKLLIFITKPS